MARWQVKRVNPPDNLRAVKKTGDESCDKAGVVAPRMDEVRLLIPEQTPEPRIEPPRKKRGTIEIMKTGHSFDFRPHGMEVIRMGYRRNHIVTNTTTMMLLLEHIQHQNLHPPGKRIGEDMKDFESFTFFSRHERGSWSEEQGWFVWKTAV